MPQSFSSLSVHLIFSTKTRTPTILHKDRLFEYIGGIANASGFVLLSAGGMPDHVHLLVSLGREHSIAEVVRVIKANSSKWIHETFPEEASFGWQAGYAAFSVSRSNIDGVKAYLANQEAHHRTRTFQEEHVEFLKRHNLPYDDRYIWD